MLVHQAKLQEAEAALDEAIRLDANRGAGLGGLCGVWRNALSHRGVVPLARA
jgi:hypothetical protein